MANYDNLKTISGDGNPYIPTTSKEQQSESDYWSIKQDTVRTVHEPKMHPNMKQNMNQSQGRSQNTRTYERNDHQQLLEELFKPNKSFTKFSQFRQLTKKKISVRLM